MATDWKALAQLDSGGLESALLDQAEKILAVDSAPEEDRLLADLPEPLRAVWLMSWLDYEISQGSLLAYFYNSHGRHVSLAIGMLRNLGAARMADVLNEAQLIHQPAAAEWDDRRAELHQLGEGAVVTPYVGLSNTDQLNALTDRYWQAAADDDWVSRLDAYLREQVTLLAG